MLGHESDDSPSYIWCPFGDIELNGGIIAKGTEGVFTIYLHIPYITL